MAAKTNSMTRAVGILANRVRGLFRWAAVKSCEATELPTLVEIESRGKVELVQPFGFKAIPKAADGSGQPFVLTAGQGSDAVGVACVDFRFEPTDVTAGNSVMYNATGQRLDCKSTGFVSNAAFDATGYKAGGTAGVSGQLVITIGAPAPTGAVTIQIKGGIVTSVSGTGSCVWSPSV